MLVVLALATSCEEAPSGTDTGSAVRCDPAEPRQSWETFGQGFVTSQCQGCHASSAPDRFGAPEAVVFDTEGDVIALSGRILARATGPEADMPPAGGPTEDDRIRLERWLRCDLPGE